MVLLRGHSDPTGGLFIGFILGLWSFFKGFKVMREYKVLQDTPRMPIRSVPMGFVHIRGKAESGEVLSSPISHTPCCFYKVEIDEWKSSGQSHEWKHCCTDMNGYRFHLTDDTGKILIDAHSAEYDLPLVTTRVVSSHASIPAAADQELLKYVSYARMHSMTDRMGQWVDKRLEKSSPVDNPAVQERRDAFRALFTGIPASAQGGGPPIAALQKLASLSGPLKDPEKEEKRQMFLQRLQMAESASGLGLLDGLMHNNDAASGRFQLREYAVVPGQEYLISGSCVENTGDNRDQERCFIGKGQNEPTFVISTKTDAEIHHALEKRALLMIFGGAGVALVCATALLVHFGLLHLF